MTAADLQTLAAQAHEQTQLVAGMAEQARLRGLTTETPIRDGKLRRMDPDLLATIRATGKDKT